MTALVCLSMLTVAVPASATHNSVGVSAQIVQADEVVLDDQAAEPVGTIVNDTGAALRVDFHDQTAPRPAPVDQVGERYRGDECDTFGEIQANGDAQEDGYNPSQDETDCYIGFFDAQLEYKFLLVVTEVEEETGVVLFSGNKTSGEVYPANPAPGDGFCRGEDDTANRSVAGQPVPVVAGDDSAADEAIAGATRSGDPECSGSDHHVHDPAHDTVAIDTDLLEQQSIAAGEALGTNTGSGTLTFPAFAGEYIFLFGQPHEDAVSSDFEAGQGPFGPNPAEMGSPLTDLTGACGTGEDQRTEECRLLTPDDIEKYDADDDLNPKTPEQTGARVCQFAPQFFAPTPGDLTVGPCGPFGTQVDTFYAELAAGGLGVSDTPTWANTLPGWHTQTTLLNHQSSTEFADFNCDGGSACHDYLEDGNHTEPGNLLYYAVNPRVPTPDHPLWCVKPNFIGDDGTTDAGVQHNGYFGYSADAIDADVYTHATHRTMLDVREVAHDPVRDVVGPVQQVLPIERDEVTSAQAFVSATDNLGDETVESLVNDQNPPGIVSEGIDRADFTESGSEEAHASFHPGDYDGDEAKAPEDAENQRPFTSTQEAGVGCDAFGVPRVQDEDKTQFGGLDFDVGFVPQTAATSATPAQASVSPPSIKDPTLLEDLLPAGEEGTEHGGWEVKTYGINGSLRGVLESNEDGDFDPCTQALGQPQPSRDLCPWQPVWDTYNPACVGPNDESCESIVNASGYDNGTGVGLYVVLHVTGPVVVYDEDADDGSPDADRFQERLAVLGDESGIGATHCLVATTTGFAPKLADQLGLDSTDALTDELCRAGIDGESELIEDGFDDQTGSGSADFSSQIELAKLLPTPAGLRNDLQTGFGDDDEVCANAVFAVQDQLPEADGFKDTDGDGDRETKDSAGHIRLEAGQTYRFQDCDRLESANDGQH